MTRKERLFQEAFAVKEEAAGLLEDRGYPTLAMLARRTNIEWREYDTFAGRAMTIRRNGDGPVVVAEVGLSWPIFADPENEGGLRQTVLHELGHVVALTGGHGDFWRHVVEVMGGVPSRFHQMTCVESGSAIARRTRYLSRRHAKAMKADRLRRLIKRVDLEIIGETEDEPEDRQPVLERRDAWCLETDAD